MRRALLLVLVQSLGLLSRIASVTSNPGAIPGMILRIDYVWSTRFGLYQLWGYNSTYRGCYNPSYPFILGHGYNMGASILIYNWWRGPPCLRIPKKNVDGLERFPPSQKYSRFCWSRYLRSWVGSSRFRILVAICLSCCTMILCKSLSPK